MRTPCSIVAAGLLAAGGAHAQVSPDSEPVLTALKEPAPFAKDFAPFPRTYAINEAENPNHKLFKGMFTTDPRLLFGVALTPTLSLEAGYANLFDQGFHKIDPRDIGDTAGALFTKGFSTHAAVRYTVPVGERLSVWGKFGIAYSALPDGARRDPGLPAKDSGAFVGVGATYKLSKRAAINGQLGVHGDAASKFGKWTNATGLKADLKVAL